MDLITYALCKNYINQKISDNLFDHLTDEQLAELKGEKGSTPTIGENGNWWIDDSDTGVYAGSKVEGADSLIVNSDKQEISSIKDGEQVVVANASTAIATAKIESLF